MVRTTGLKNYSNIHYTRSETAQTIINHFSPFGRILEPFRGGGAFYQHLPQQTDWCEIEDGVDFFDSKGTYDWIITNPPFENLTDIMAHAFSIAENTVFLIPVSKFYSSNPRIQLSRKLAPLRFMLHVGTGRDIGFDIGFPFAAMHFQRGYDGPISEKFI